MIKRIHFSLLSLRAILAAFEFSALAMHAEDWPMLGRDQTRNPVSPERGAPVEWDTQTGENIKWRARLGSITFSAPVIAKGLVWIGTNNGNPRDAGQTNVAGVLMCFRESDGRFLYEHVSPARRGALDRQALTGNPSSPLIEGDRLWFVTTRGEVVCLDIGALERGEGAPEELWKLDMVDELGVLPRPAAMGGAGICSIAASFRDRIYVITGNGTGWNNLPANPRATALVCLNRNTGQVLWEDDSSSNGVLFGEWGSPLVIEINGHGQVVAPQGDGWLRSFDALTGELIWKFDINPKNARWLDGRGIFTTPPVFYGNRIYIALGNYLEWGSGPGRLVCIDPTKTGDLSLELGDGPGKGKPNPQCGVVWHFDGIYRTMAMVAIHDGLVIAPDFGGIVHCLDADTGRVNWTHDLRAEVFASPLIADGKVYLGDGAGNLTIFALSKTKQVIARHSMTTNHWISSSPIFANGVLYLAVGEELHAIEEQPVSWPQWRGADHSNASRESALLREWPPGGPPLLWSATGLGEGIHSVSVAGGKLFTVGSHQGSEFAIALSVRSGDRVWATRLGPAMGEHPLMRWLTQRTPTVDGGRVFLLSANGEMICLSAADGGELWRKGYRTDFGAHRPVAGYGDHLLVDDEKLICTPATTNAALVALNKATGETIWRTVLDGAFAAGYAATVVSEVCGVRQYVASFGFGLVGVRAADGKLLWRFERPQTHLASAYTPIVYEDSICSPNGYGGGIVGIQLTKHAGTFLARQTYQRYPRLDAFQDSSARVGDHLYLVEGGTPLCVDLKSGTYVWREDLKRAAQRTALTYAEGRLYLRRATGMIELVEVNPEGTTVKGSFPIPGQEQSVGVTFPVVAGGRLYLRDDDRLHCYDVSADALRTARPTPNTLTIALTEADRLLEDRSTRPPSSGLNRAPDAVFIPTPQDIVEKMLEVASVRKSDIVVDLGSGDGRVVITAAKLLGAKSIGYEVVECLVEQSRAKIAQEGLQSLARIEHADLFTVDLKEPDVIFVFLYPQLMERLIPRFAQLKAGSRIVSHQFEIPGVKPDREWVVPSKEDGEKHRLFLWTTPLRKD